jgi:hypothetical protein
MWRLRSTRGWLPALAAAATMVAAGPAGARELSVPLTLDSSFLRAALVTQIYRDGGERAVLWGTPGSCRYLVLARPVVGTSEGHVRVLSHAALRAGTGLLGLCWSAVNWEGQVEAALAPELPAGAWVLRFRIADSRLFDRAGREPLLTGRLWDLVKDEVHARLGRFEVDLSPPGEALRQLLPLVVARGDRARIEPLLASLRAGPVAVTPEAVVVPVLMDVAAPPPAAPVPEAPLTAEEVAAWEAALERWDGFLTFVVRRMARETTLGPLRAGLFEALVDGRTELVAALTRPVHAEDPVRRLFLATWERLRPLARDAAHEVGGDRTLRYLSFITAGDALAALDALGPAVDLEISADGLRRLARALDPEVVADPLAYDLVVDPELRRLFGFGAPLPLPPRALPPPPPPPGPPLSWLGPAPAQAALPGDADELGAKLDRWVPQREELPHYLATVGELLRRTSAAALALGSIPEAYHGLYRRLVLATAWQESCWRQYRRRNGTVTYLQSSAGAVGLMQVNARVWRGFYEADALRWNVPYNARAGEEILRQYLLRYGLDKNEHVQVGGAENLARAAYAAYNGGPGHYRRYRLAATSRRLKRIDAAFYAKFRALGGGRAETLVAGCYGA